MNGWINIEDHEPPKDGTPFLGYDPKQDKFSNIYVLVYIPEKRYPPGEFFELSYDSYYRESSGEQYFRWNPTHWMPLPNIP